ncbi:hypothetical protein EOL28_28645 [Citrobacter freundii]|nr:hypothetical protein EOL28_28645 [Citrobacter freundii]
MTTAPRYGATLLRLPCNSVSLLVLETSSGSISGGVVAWAGGINLANHLSETFAIINAPGLEGAYINGQKYRETNSKGTIVTRRISVCR